MKPKKHDDLLPVLYIPGILSSGLEIRKSAVSDKHIGNRVWMNPISLQRKKGRRRSDFFSNKESPRKRDDKDDSDSEKSDVEDLECNRAWLQHMSLTADMCTEREGNEIRPIPGLDGVDFLADIVGISIGASYVFGPIIKILTELGYVKGRNLDGCPYDWRIPPLCLEERDGYFSKTMERIEKMFLDCDCNPVVLLCHSMGGKVGHYLLNFVLEKLGASAGRAWIDKHVHTYMPLGAPHIGVPEIIGTTFSGSLHSILDKMLSLPERLVLTRSMGSGVWLMPTTLPYLERNAIPSILCKQEGKLTVTILATDDHPLGDLQMLVATRDGARTISNIQIKVSYGCKKTDENRVKIRSGKGVRVPQGDNPYAQYFAFPGPRFIFPTPASILDGEQSLKPLRFTIYEVGRLRKRSDKYKINLGMSSVLDDIDTKKLVAAGNKGITITVPIVARADMTRDKVPKPKHRFIDMKVNIKWEPPMSNHDDDLDNPIAMIPDNSSAHYFAPMPSVQSNVDGEENIDYVPLSGQTMLRAEGLDVTFAALAKDKYSAQCDTVDPRGRSSYEKPPVKRIYAIYGINIDTHVSTVCKRVSRYHEDETPHELLARPRFEIDTETRILDAIDSRHNDETMTRTRSGHKLEDGRIYEHAGTPQMDLLNGNIIYCSGDGSVPYYSLQQPQEWAKELANNPMASEAGETVKIEEIEGAEHRDILSNERLHTLLVDYLTGVTIL